MGLRFLLIGPFISGCSLIFPSSDLRHDGAVGGDGGEGGAVTGGSGGSAETSASTSDTASSSAMSSSSTGVQEPCGNGVFENDEACDNGVANSTGLCADDCLVLRECPSDWYRGPDGGCFRILSTGPGVNRANGNVECENAGQVVFASHPEIRAMGVGARTAVAKSLSSLRFLYCLGETPSEPFCLGYEVGTLDVIGWIGASNPVDDVVLWDDGTNSTGPWSNTPQSQALRCVVVYQGGLHEVGCDVTSDIGQPTRPTCELLVPVAP